jgi:predicted RNA-binding Zn-ribbon protein involved in translation (DUF1610 family)
MVGGSRIVGILLVAGALVVALGVVLWFVSAYSEGQLSQGGMSLGVALLLLVLAPIVAVGAYLMVLGGREAASRREADATRKLLNMVVTRGKVSIGEASHELGLPQSAVREVLYDAVGQGLFSGYINWQEGVLYAREAAEGKQTCPNCGGTIEIAGRGVFQCPYCGTEIFHARGAEGSHEIRGIAPPGDEGPMDGNVG